MESKSQPFYKEFSVYISYSVNDHVWSEYLTKKFEANGILVYLKCEEVFPESRTEDDDDTCLNECSLHILLFSAHYVKQSFLWKRFLPYTKKYLNKKIGPNSVKGLLDTKPLLCILLSSCVVPEEFNEELVMDFSCGDKRNQCWKKLLKFIENIKQRRFVRNLLLSPMHRLYSQSEANTSFNNDEKQIVEPMKIEHSKDGGIDGGNGVSLDDETVEESEDEDNEIVEKSQFEDDFENDLNLSVPEYRDKIAPHLLLSKFQAEDDDLTKKHLESLVLKMEDVDTILFGRNIDESKEMSKSRSKFGTFASQYEQMQIIDNLQNEFERVNHKVESCSDVLKKRSYRRLSEIYDKCIMSAINGRKETELLNCLPDIVGVSSKGQTNSIVCCCCGNMFHSERALEIHFSSCVTHTWKVLLES